MSKRIFISYGTADASQIAEWLSHELSNRGYEPWWDKQQLPGRVGLAWDEEIEKAIRSSDAVIALMSPHAVRARGECRNEINFACDQSKRVVPVLVRKCERPIRLSSLQYVDLEGFDAMGAAARAAQLDLLLRAIEEGPQEDAACAALHAHFPRFDFEWMYARHKHFTGRKWLLDRFDGWLHGGSEPVLFLVGPPGIGKSAVLTAWIKERLRIGAIHFCRHDREDLKNPQAMVASLAGQLLRHDLPGHREALQAYLSDPRASKDPSAMMDRLVLDPLRQPGVGGPWVIAIDALDEGGSPIYDLLAQVKPYLEASRIRLLVTSRPESEILQLFENKVVLQASGAENLADLHAYVHERLASMRVTASVSEAERREVEQRICAQSEGTFLIAQVTLDELESGRMLPEQLEGMPAGLRPLYASYFQRRYPTRDSFTAVRDALEVVMGAHEPVTDDFIAKVLGRKPRQVTESLLPLGSLIPKTGASGARVPFHKSLFDWLDEQEPGTRHAVSRDEGRQRLASALETEGIDDPYALRWRVRHLMQEGRKEIARSWLRKLTWLQRRVEAGQGGDVREELGAMHGDAALAELKILWRQRLPMWLCGASRLIWDAVNLSRLDGELHRLALEQAPRPFFELLSARGELREDEVFLPHAGMEFVVPLSGGDDARDGQPWVVTFSSERFIVWTQDGRQLNSGKLARVPYPDRQLGPRSLVSEEADDHVEADMWFEPPWGFRSRPGDPQHYLWFESHAEGRVTAVRISQEWLDFVELTLDGRSLADTEGLDVQRALGVLGAQRRKWSKPGTRHYVMRVSFPFDASSSTWVYSAKTHRPVLAMKPVKTNTQGGMLFGRGERYVWEIIGRNLCKYFRGHLDGPSRFVNEESQSWAPIKTVRSRLYWSVSDYRQRSDETVAVFESRYGRYLIWRSDAEHWLVWDSQRHQIARIELSDVALACTWCMNELSIMLVMAHGCVRRIKLSALLFHDVAQEVAHVQQAGFSVEVKRIGLPKSGFESILPDRACEDLRPGIAELILRMRSMQWMGTREKAIRAFRERYAYKMPDPSSLGWGGLEIDRARMRFSVTSADTLSYVLNWEPPEIECIKDPLWTHDKYLHWKVRGLQDAVRAEVCGMQDGDVGTMRNLAWRQIYRAHYANVNAEKLNRLRADMEMVDDWVAFMGCDASFWFAEHAYILDMLGADNTGKARKAAISQRLQDLVRACCAWVAWTNRGAEASASEAPPPELNLVYDFVEVPYVGLPDTTSSRGGSGEKSFVRIGWSADGALQALSASAASVWTFRVDESATGPDGRLRGLGAARYAGGSLPRPERCTEWNAAGWRLQEKALEVRVTSGGVARYVHSVGLKGFVPSPSDPDMVAALDTDGKVVVLRVHR